MHYGVQHYLRDWGLLRDTDRLSLHLEAIGLGISTCRRRRDGRKALSARGGPYELRSRFDPRAGLLHHLG